MTLDEAIQNQEEMIKSCEEKINDVRFISKTRLGKDIIFVQSEYIQECEQYIEWLKDYKRLLEQEKRYTIIIPKGATREQIFEEVFGIRMMMEELKNMEWWNAPYRSESEET